MAVSTAEVRSYLERLGFSVSGDGEPFEVELPSWRPDIAREEDLIEEIGRVHGYEKIPILPPAGSTPIGGLRGIEKVRETIKDCLLRHGLVQTVSHSLRDTHPLDSPNWQRIGPNNQAHLKWRFADFLWPSLSDAALRNGAKDVHLFNRKVHAI
jgi:phenylalanyl-tRNA synthetase beta chain